MKFTENEITLRYAEPSDAQQLTAWWNDGEVMAHAGFPNGLGTTVSATLKNITDVTNNKGRLFIIEISNVAVGEVSFRIIGGKTVEIGIKICESNYQNKGYGIQILRLFTRVLFEYYGFDIITLDTNLKNERAQHVYEKVGFKRIEVKKHVWQSPQTSEWADVVYYKMNRE